MFYACVETYESTGFVCCPFVSEKRPIQRFPAILCAGVYPTHQAALEAATDLYQQKRVEHEKRQQELSERSLTLFEYWWFG